jgi:hypothetical protein
VLDRTYIVNVKRLKRISQIVYDNFAKSKLLFPVLYASTTLSVKVMFEFFLLLNTHERMNACKAAY